MRSIRRLRIWDWIETSRAETAALYARSAHPYTQALVSAIPEPDPDRRRQRIILAGDAPNPEDPPPGCAFHPRCPLVRDICRSVVPELQGIDEYRSAACHVVAGKTTPVAA